MPKKELCAAQSATALRPIAKCTPEEMFTVNSKPSRALLRTVVKRSRTRNDDLQMAQIEDEALLSKKCTVGRYPNMESKTCHDAEEQCAMQFSAV